MIKPGGLKPGDRIGIVAPASPAADEGDIRAGLNTLAALGFQVVEGKYIMRQNRYLAGTDEERADDINRFFADSSIRGIVCLRGGYGAGRILPLIDYAAMSENPKIFVGYSDITFLHLAIQNKAEMVTFYGPMVLTEMARRFSDYTQTHFLKMVSSSHPAGKIGAHTQEAQVIAEGNASGALTGGYLPVLAGSLGTLYEIDTQGKLLFFEDFKREPFEVDRCLTQLLLSGKLNKAAGIVIGECIDCEPKGRFPSSFSCGEVFQHRLGNLGIPVLSGLCFGHGDHKATIPMGVKAVLNTADKSLEIVEPAVKEE